jgi:hypothetical protein
MRSASEKITTTDVIRAVIGLCPVGRDIAHINHARARQWLAQSCGGVPSKGWLMDVATKKMKSATAAAGGADELPWGFDRRATGGGPRAPQPRQVLVYPCRPEGLARPIRASITDASPTGIGLTCLGRLEVGSRFVLRLDQPGRPPSLQVFHVIRCREAGGASLVGAVFDHPFTGTCPLTPPQTNAAASC